jgi:hypothetical protein
MKAKCHNRVKKSNWSFVQLETPIYWMKFVILSKFNEITRKLSCDDSKS